MELSEVLHGAQEAMNRGDYRLAVAAGAHAAETYPNCLTARRILGEAYLELGDADTAIQQLSLAIQYEPLNVVSHLGSGVAEEERQRPTEAYAAYLHAWEINPALDQVRDELVRLRSVLNGDERLHPTRAGLAGIYVRSGQYARAVTEWRAVLAAEPTNTSALTALVETLWRMGDDASALAECRAALQANRENARLLAIAAEVERRKNGSVSAELVGRYQAVDPNGEIASLLEEWRSDADVSHLRLEQAPIAEFDFAGGARTFQDIPVALPEAVGVSLAGTRVQGAPDLWDSLVRDFNGDLPPGFAGADPNVAAELQPFSWPDEGGSAPPPVADDPFAIEGWLGGNEKPVPTIQAVPAARGTDELLSFAAVAPPPSIPPAAEPAPVAPAAPTNGHNETFVTADGRIDLTAGWDDLDRALKDATPSFDAGVDYDALAAEIGLDGVAPFVMDDPGFDASAWAPFSDDDVAPVPAPKRTSSDTAPGIPLAAAVEAPFEPPVDVDPAFHVEPFAAMASESDSSDVLGEDTGLLNELSNEIPGPTSSGYTELLRNVDIDLPESTVRTDSLESIDPFANPDSAGAPLDFEELIAATSKAGTADLSAAQGESDSGEPSLDMAAQLDGLDGIAPFEFLANDDQPMLAPPSSEPEAEVDQFDALLAGLGDVEPFSLDDLGRSSDLPSDVVDFTEINEERFDPAKYSGAIGGGVPVEWSRQPEEAQPIGPSADAEPIELAAAASAWEELAPVAASAVPVQPSPIPAAPQVGTGGLRWPAVMGSTPNLHFQSEDGSTLFGRLRRTRSDAHVSDAAPARRSINELRPKPAFHVEHWEAQPIIPFESPAAVASPPEPRGESNKTNQADIIAIDGQRSDLIEMRIRLIEDDDSAEEIAQNVEAMIGQGINDPLALRVLGEAYLKMGRTEQAAAQFRQAMLARRRAR